MAVGLPGPVVVGLCGTRGEQHAADRGGQHAGRGNLLQHCKVLHLPLRCMCSGRPKSRLPAAVTSDNKALVKKSSSAYVTNADQRRIRKEQSLEFPPDFDVERVNPPAL